MSKLFSIRFKPAFHRHKESEVITLITKRTLIEVWVMGVCFSFNIGIHPHYEGRYYE